MSWTYPLFVGITVVAIVWLLKLIGYPVATSPMTKSNSDDGEVTRG